MTHLVKKFSKTILFIVLPLVVLVGVYILSDQNKITDKAQAAAGLVGYWNFDETSGTTAVDYSGNNNTGTLINGPVWTTGKVGNALSFDGTNDYINIGSLNGLDTTQSITLEAWVNFNNIVDPTERYIIGSRPIVAGQDTISLAGLNDGTRFSTQNQARSVVVFGAVSSNTWNHIVGVREVSGTNETLKLYINGVLKATNTYTSLSVIPNYWAIGRLGGTAAYYHSGLIDEVKIYNRTLSADEVLVEYSGGAPTPTPSVTPTPTLSITPTPIPSSTPTPIPTPTPSITPTPTPIPDGNVPINNIIVSAIKTDSVNIAWDSTSAGTSIIEYGASASYGSQTAEDSLAYFHTQTITGLTAGALYHYRIRTKDINNVETISGNYTFTARTQTQLDAVIRAARADGQLPKTYYVSPAGNDANNGLSTSAPFQHPSYAVNKTDAGDTVYLMDGTWASEHITFPKSGIDVAPITLTAINKGGAILDGQDMTCRDGNNPCAANSGIVISAAGNNFIHNYINVSNIKITNYSYGIMVREAHHINISEMEVFNTAGSAIFAIDDNNILIQNSYLHDNGGFNYDGAGVGDSTVQISTGYYQTYKYSIIGNTIINNPGTSAINGSAGHNLIDLNNNADAYGYYLQDINITGNTLSNSGMGGIFPHGSNIFRMERINVSNNIMNNLGAPVYVHYLHNSTIQNNTMSNSTYCFETSNPNPGAYSVDIRNNTCINAILDVLVSTNQTDGGIVSFTNDSISIYRITMGIAYVINPIKSIYHILTSTWATPAPKINLKYTDRTVFIENGAGAVIYYPDRSEYITVGDEDVLITKYPMTATPATGSATVSVASFNTSLAFGSVLANFTADTTNGNNVTFTVSTLKSNTNYLIKKGVVDYTIVQADSTGKITFSNSIWPSNNFTVTETTGGTITPTPTPQITAIQGTVSNSSGTPIAGAAVTAGANSTTTNASGFYTLSIPAGTYTITVTASSSGYAFQSKSANVVTAQTTTVNFILTSPVSSADLNSDGIVNSVDFGIMMSAWNSTTKPKADINQDGTVNSVDFGIMMSQWGG